MIVPFSWTSKKYINWQKNRDISIFIKMFMVFWHKLVQSRKLIYGRDIKVIYYTHPRNPHSPAELKIQIFMHVHTGQNKKIPAYMFFDSLRLISNKILDSWSRPHFIFFEVGGWFYFEPMLSRKTFATNSLVQNFL